MNDATPRLLLPMLVPGQAQKEMSHNEALTVLDAVVQASAVALGTQTPPTDPTIGECWIIGDAPTGDWAARARNLAIWTAGGWRFVEPTPGFRAWVVEDGAEARFGETGWNAASPAAPIPDPSGGATVDSGARTAIAAILAVLRRQNLVQGP